MLLHPLLEMLLLLRLHLGGARHGPVWGAIGFEGGAGRLGTATFHPTGVCRDSTHQRKKRRAETEPGWKMPLHNICGAPNELRSESGLLRG